MERKIGDCFSYKGTMLEVVELSIKDKDAEEFCNGCFFNENFPYFCYGKRKIIGECLCYSRTDGKDVIFKKV